MGKTTVNRPLVISRKTTVAALQTFLRGKARVKMDFKHKLLYLLTEDDRIVYVLPRTVLVDSPERGLHVVTHGEYVRTYINFIKEEIPHGN